MTLYCSSCIYSQGQSCLLVLQPAAVLPDCDSHMMVDFVLDKGLSLTVPFTVLYLDTSLSYMHISCAENLVPIYLF